MVESRAVSCAECDVAMIVEANPRSDPAPGRTVGSQCLACGAVLCWPHTSRRGKRVCPGCGERKNHIESLAAADFGENSETETSCRNCGASVVGIVVPISQRVGSKAVLGRVCRDCGYVLCESEGKALGVGWLDEWMVVPCSGCGVLGGFVGTVQDYDGPDAETKRLLRKLEDELWVANPGVRKRLQSNLAAKVPDIAAALSKGLPGWGGPLAVARIVELGVAWPLTDSDPGEVALGYLDTMPATAVEAVVRIEAVERSGDRLDLVASRLSEVERPRDRAAIALRLSMITWDQRAPQILRSLLDDDGGFSRNELPELGRSDRFVALLNPLAAATLDTATITVAEVAAEALDRLGENPTATAR